MIDVVFSPSVHGSLRVATNHIKLMKEELELYEMELEPKLVKDSEFIISLEFRWDIGDLKQPEDSDYRMTLPAKMYFSHYVRLHPEEKDSLMTDGKNNLKQLALLKKFAEEGYEFRVWYSTYPEEMCGLYYVCNILADYGVKVHVVKMPELVSHTGKVRQLKGWGTAYSADFGYIADCQKELTDEEIVFYSSRWHELVEENTPLRVTFGDSVLSVPENFYDGLLLSSFCTDEMKEVDIAKTVMRDIGLYVTDGLISHRLWAMGEQGILELLKDGENMHDRVWRKL